MNLGIISKYKVDRETKIGYTLIQDNVEYFLHHNECNGRHLEKNQEVYAFLYCDKMNRPTLTLHQPLITLNKIEFLQVVSVRNDLGVFCNIGINKDILLSKDDLPDDYRLWPKINDEILCTLKTTHKNRLILKPVSKNDIIKHEKESHDLMIGEVVEGICYRITPDGVNFVTKSLDLVFVFKSNFRKDYRIGEVEEIKIIDKHEFDYSGTITKNKEIQIQDDKAIILDYLNKNNGVMLITDKSSPELINYNFHMSKSAFKKVIGGLYKDGVIVIMDDKIVLKD